MKPKVSIITSVYDQEKFISDSISSILGQTFKDFEFIVLDDCSTDSTLDQVKKHSDVRIKVFKNEKNLGLTKSLNNLLSICQGEYVARIDLDDVCEKNRIGDQFSFLENNKEFGMVSSCYKAIDENNQEQYTHCPSSDPIGLKWSLIFRNNIRHSTVMWRNNLQERYDEYFRYAQDYDLWCRIARKTKIGVLNYPATNVRCHSKAITSQFYSEQEFFATNVTKKQFEFYVNKNISLLESKNLRLFYFLKDSNQFNQFNKINEEGLVRSVENYLDLLICFLDKESVDVSAFENDIDNDLKSVYQMPERRNQLVFALKNWFMEKKEAQQLNIIKKKYVD